MNENDLVTWILGAYPDVYVESVVNADDRDIVKLPKSNKKEGVSHPHHIRLYDRDEKKIEVRKNSHSYKDYINLVACHPADILYNAPKHSGWATGYKDLIDSDSEIADVNLWFQQECEELFAEKQDAIQMAKNHGGCALARAQEKVLSFLETAEYVKHHNHLPSAYFIGLNEDVEIMKEVLSYL